MKIDYKEKSHRYLVDGKPLPSVTTILGYVGKPGLMAWLKKHPEEFIAAEKERTATIGDQVHEAIERALRGEVGQIQTEYPGAVQAGIRAFLAWSQKVKLEPLYLETPIATLKGGYAGRPDFVGKINGKIAVADWKTGNRIYPEYQLQLAAYGMAVVETHGITPEDYYICRLDKESGIPEIQKIERPIDELYAVFSSVKKIYDFIKEAEKNEKKTVNCSLRG